MLVSAKEMLDKAKAGHYAVGQFNINNLEWTKSVLLTAEELRSPVILGAVSYTHLDVYKRQSINRTIRAGMRFHVSYRRRIKKTPGSAGSLYYA